MGSVDASAGDCGKMFTLKASTLLILFSTLILKKI